jgi:hypothetical protein
MLRHPCQETKRHGPHVAHRGGAPKVCYRGDVPIDFERRIAFIHIPKTGGSSVEALLGLNTDAAFFSPTPLKHLTPSNKTPQHFTLRELRANVGEALTDFFRFAFVRNPWDRFASEYVWRRRWYLAKPADRTDYFYGHSHLESMDKFVRALEIPESQRIDARRGFDAHLETQSSFLLDEAGEVGVDYIGRFERFREDLSSVARRLGRDPAAIQWLKRSRRHTDYRLYYSAFSRSAVERFYEEDIRRFEYRF